MKQNKDTNHIHNNGDIQPNMTAIEFVAECLTTSQSLGRALLLALKAHITVEIAATVDTVKYLKNTFTNATIEQCTQ